RTLAYAISASLLALAASDALAQEAPPTTTPQLESNESDGETIVVTGSRIKRAGFDTLEPATVIDAE
ncbi:MAG: hypothetical protein ACREB0_08195, partial [Sphingopyxis sp.]